MKTIHEIIHEAQTHKLKVFDFDDTLVWSKSRVHVTHSNGKTTSLTPGEYAVYNSKPGDEFDYSEFAHLIEPKEIKGMVRLFKKILVAGTSKVYILTARPSTNPVDAFLTQLGVRKIPVVALASGDPQKKADWIESKIKSGFTDIEFFDDSEKNIRAVDKLKRKYTNVKLKTRLIKA